MKIRTTIVSALMLSAASVTVSAQNAAVNAVRIGDRIDVTIGDKFFTSYTFRSDEKYPFFFPVNGPVSGGSVTSMRNAIYPHHSSLFFGCDHVNGGNWWQEGLDRGRIVSQGARVVASGGDRAVIKDECIWQRPDAESPIRDSRTITIFSPSDKLYIIDFDIVMEMLMDVTIETTNHSLFSARIAEDLTVKQGGTMVNALGDSGEQATFGTPAPWMDYCGSRKTGTEGIAIMQHPSNKWYPSRWFTRDYGFMSPTPMNWPENGKSTILPKGEKVNLSYRVVVHSGDTQEADIAGLFEDYSRESRKVVLMTLDPGHFHAALVQKSGYPVVSDSVYVYAPEGDDLNGHLRKIEGYNSRKENPTQWKEVVYTGSDFLEKMLSEKKGNVMVTAGNNSRKTEYMLETLKAGVNVLADKPMAIDAENFKILEECFRAAEENGVLLYDIMTERFEISTILQKELSLIPEIYGEQLPGTPDEPGISIESAHHFYKNVSGSALVRPAWFYDVRQQGEGMTDVMVHLVDLVQWECFPEQVLDYTRDIEITSARHWTTPVTREQFRASTGLDNYPSFLQKDVRGGVLEVFANGEINYKLKGLNARVKATWEFEALQGGGDTHYSTMRGSKSSLLIKQGAEQGFVPELYIVPCGELPGIENSFATLAGKYPGIYLEKSGNGWHVVIPAEYRTGHEAHFGQVTSNFLDYLSAGKLPEWEVPGMLAKYYTTTEALKKAALAIGDPGLSDVALPQVSEDSDCYLFSYFADQADGLHLAWSTDGYRWHQISGGRSLLKPEIGPDKLMRDPSICQGPDGTFHLVWTTGWHDRIIGHASSRDLIEWSSQQVIPVMEHEPEAKNCWAPEIFYDDSSRYYYIFWATTIPGRHSEVAESEGEKGMNHRIYYTRTRDFKKFSRSEIYFNPPFSAIDAAVVRDPVSGDLLMTVKNENPNPPEKNIRTSRSKSMQKGFPVQVSEPIHGEFWAEGPSPLFLGRDTLIVYYDRYMDGCYGASVSYDHGDTWEEVPDSQLEFPENIRHGTAFKVSADVLNKLFGSE